MNQPMNTSLYISQRANQSYDVIGPEIAKTVKVHLVY